MLSNFYGFEIKTNMGYDVPEIFPRVDKWRDVRVGLKLRSFSEILSIRWPSVLDLSGNIVHDFTRFALNNGK